MKAALIPPKGYESTAHQYSSIHLGLPIPDCVNNPDYVQYLQDAHGKSHYIIMDNGCAEGQLVDPEAMLRFAKFVGADEVVAPDVMGNMAETLRLTQEFEQNHKHGFNVMGVLQGQNREEIEHLLACYYDMDINTIGIPKVLIRKSGDRIRSGVARMIQDTYKHRFAIHLLGLSSKFPTEMHDVDFPSRIRSMDSAQPYKVSEDDVTLQYSTIHHKRREDYFREFKWMNSTLLRINIMTFIGWAEKHD